MKSSVSVQMEFIKDFLQRNFKEVSREINYTTLQNKFEQNDEIFEIEQEEFQPKSIERSGESDRFIQMFIKKMYGAGYDLNSGFVKLPYGKRIEMLLEMALERRCVWKVRIECIEELMKMLYGCDILKVKFSNEYFIIDTPRKYYVYYLINHKSEIIYIGKGTKKRAWEHLKRPDTNLAKSTYIKSEQEAGRRIKVFIFKDNLTESESLKLERQKIKFYRNWFSLFNILSGNNTKENGLISILKRKNDKHGISDLVINMLTVGKQRPNYAIN